MPVCQSCGYGFYVYQSIPPAKCDACYSPIVYSRTQKGKGLGLLNKLDLESTPIKGIVQVDEHITKANIKYPIFARPAPSEPRHGYIDSRVVTKEKELRDLLKQVLSDDPSGEIILCNFINSAYSAVWTPGSMVIGRGNTGATSGEDTITIPLVDCKYIGIPKDQLKSVGIKSDQWPYLEVVYAKDAPASPVYTQLRAGPRLPRVTGDYIPSPVLVKEILKADPSKFRDTGWEKAIEAVEGKDGVVVWYPGGAMTCHFAIHAFLAKLPIIFSRLPPRVGDVLEPTCEAKAFNPWAMLEGVVIGDSIKYNLDKQTEVYPFIIAAFIALHNSTVMTDEASKWLGCAAATVLRIGTAALIAEARHLHMPADINKGKSRTQIYREVSCKNLGYHRARVNRLINIFRYGTWGGAFGGLKWACCGAATSELFNAVYQLAADPTDTTASAVVKALNIAVNQAHNGGWWLNKFVEQQSFNLVAAGSYGTVLHGVPAFFQWGSRKLSTEELSAKTQQIIKWGRVSLSPPRVTSAKVTLFPSLKTLEVSVVSRLLNTSFKPIMAKLANVELDYKSLKQNLYLIESDDGFRLEYRKNDPVVVWQDASLKDLSLKASAEVK